MKENISEDIQLKIKALLDEIMKLCKQYNIYHYNIISDMKERAVDYHEFHKDCLKLVASVVQDSKNSNMFLENYRHFKKQNSFSGEFPFAIADYYLRYFKDAYFTIKDGKHIISDNYKIKDMTDKNEHKKNINCIHLDVMYPVLITPEGDGYFGQYGHESLCKWLYLNDNKDLHSSLRIDVDFHNKRFEFSSIFGYVEDDDKENLIQLTNPQTDTFGKLHKTMLEMYGEMAPLHESALYSSGLGLGSHERPSEISQHNLNKFSKYFGKDFNLLLYKRYKVQMGILLP